jgi:phosphatidate cytidylyltransferase
MNQYLRNLTAEQQVSALFIIVFGLLFVTHVTVFMLSLRERGDTPQAEVVNARLAEARALLRTSWAMVIVFWVGWASGEGVATTLFAIVAFFALREFITLSPTRRGDHRSLVLAFFVVLPIQFWLVATAHFDLFTVFIPVYVFLAIPVVSALADDPQRFLERNAKLQWGIMVCVYGMSHVPALLLLQFPEMGKQGAFPGVLPGVCGADRHAGSASGQPPLAPAPQAPNVSQSFNWTSWSIGVAAGSLLGGLLSGITPFKPGQAMAMALIACVAGSMGHLVMKALKRDRGVPNWGAQGHSVTGASGLLDRVDALCFAAPVFFHSVRWYFGPVPSVKLVIVRYEY